ncbi:ADP-ribosylglycohydrolase family protein [Halanaerobium saccharolyticum subsp. saccharolyticum DSM 6643]|uniref:ADP-ribosylglycohydrolase family protein n=1 Tax=Halanaerobium saccharolyticum subsp. saccharolyticum DSM 6643 TaxID=1293054 RepID=M5EC32_9FIRM|nr:ADP-ribosylglycohydrolase family protein [Halanaerobium saccharolyticum]CCU78383.1 ADP-ribosylglycohydrolase family protein [Halanaerobium saccharolyticum subsp. saccharolyticum DSM 6643]
MQSKRKDLVKSVMIADALSFGSHWVYDTEKLADNYSGIIKKYTTPMSKFHESKKAGDLSHYGEQAFALLQSISDHQGFDLKEFRDDWVEYLENNEMYMDHAMKDSLEKFKGSDTLIGAENVELGGISRSLSVFIEEEISKKEFLDLIHLTHNGEVVDQTAEFVFNVIQEVLAGKDYKKAIEDNKGINQFVEESFKKIGSKGKIVANADDRGQGCSIKQGFPIVLDVLWNADNILEALTLNIMAGGDTSARAMVIAAVISAAEGLNSIPEKLTTGFNKSAAVNELLAQN